MVSHPQHSRFRVTIAKGDTYKFLHEHIGNIDWSIWLNLNSFVQQPIWPHDSNACAPWILDSNEFWCPHLALTKELRKLEPRCQEFTCSNLQKSFRPQFVFQKYNLYYSGHLCKLEVIKCCPNSENNYKKGLAKYCKLIHTLSRPTGPSEDFTILAIACTAITAFQITTPNPDHAISWLSVSTHTSSSHQSSEANSHVRMRCWNSLSSRNKCFELQVLSFGPSLKCSLT